MSDEQEEKACKTRMNWSKELIDMANKIEHEKGASTPTPQDGEPPHLLAEEINALPPRVRDFVHQLESRANPAGDIARAVLLQDQNSQLQAEIKKLRGQVEELVSINDSGGDEYRRQRALVRELQRALAYAYPYLRSAKDAWEMCPYHFPDGPEEDEDCICDEEARLIVALKAAKEARR